MPGTEELRTYALTGASADAWRDLPMSEVMWEWVDVEWGVLVRGDSSLRGFLLAQGLSHKVYGAGEVRLAAGSDPVPLASLPELESDADPDQLRAWWVQLRFQAPPEWHVGKTFTVTGASILVTGMVEADVVAVYCSARALDQAQGLFGWFIEAWRPTPPTAKLVGSIDLGGEESIAVTIRLFPGAEIDIPTVVGVHLPTFEANARTIRARLRPDQVLAVARRPEVVRITRFSTAQPSGPNGMTTRIIAPVAPLELDGEGETIGFIDSGLDGGTTAGLHQDFDASRISFVLPPVPDEVAKEGAVSPKDDGSERGLGERVALTDDVALGSGHGTHVISRAIGSATAAARVMGKAAELHRDQLMIKSEAGLLIPVGVAPKAAGVVLPVTCTVEWSPGASMTGGAAGTTLGWYLIPRDVDALFDLATAKGATILNNSWNYPSTEGDYDDAAASVDRYAWNNPDVLVVFSSGNDQASLGGLPLSPATARNALTVGMVAYTTDVEPTLSGMSRRGWVDGKRFRPDLLAEGHGVWGARPSTSVVAEGAFGEAREITVAATDPALAGLYRLGIGTSQAAPLVSGFAALVRQQLRAKGGVAPSSALLRAIIALFPGPLGTTALSADHGLGLLSIRSAVTALANGEHAVLADDSYGQLAENETASYSVEVGAGATTLAAALAWTDPPELGTAVGAVQNRLVLTVEAPDGTAWAATWGSGTLYTVVVANPAAGRWKLSVVAQTVAADGPRPGDGTEKRAGYALAVRTTGSQIQDFFTPPVEQGETVPETMETPGPGGPPVPDRIPTVVVQEAVMDAAAGGVAGAIAERVGVEVTVPGRIPSLSTPFRAFWVGDGSPPGELDRVGAWLCHVQLRTPHPPPRPKLARGLGISLRASLPADESTWADAATRDAILGGERARVATLVRLLATGGECVAWETVEHDGTGGLVWARAAIDVAPGTRRLNAVVGWGSLQEASDPVVRLRDPSGRPYELGGLTTTVRAGRGWCQLQMRAPVSGRWSVEVGALADSRPHRAHIVAITHGGPALRFRARIDGEALVVVPSPNVRGVTAVSAVLAQAGRGTPGTCSFPVLVGDAGHLPAFTRVDLVNTGAAWTAPLPIAKPCTAVVRVQGADAHGAWQRVIPPFGVR